MKRKVCFLLVCVLLLTGCSPAFSGDTWAFYYQTIDSNRSVSESVIDAEVRQLTLSKETPITDLVNAYLEGPKNDGFVSPFPSDTTLISCINDDGDVSIELGGTYRNLSGISKTIAVACMVKTVMQISGVKTVTVNNDGGTLANVDNRALSSGDFALIDNESESRQVNARVYFPDTEERYLLPSTFRVMSDSTETTAIAVVQQLIAGPPNLGMNSVMPQGTKLRSLWISDGVCTVDFTQPFLTERPKSAVEERLLIFAIVNSLCELPQIDSVRFLCEGSKIGYYYLMDLSGAISPFEAINGPVRSAVGEIDASVYMVTPDQGHISEFPLRLLPEPGESEAEALLRMMFVFVPPVGYRNPIPQQATVQSCTVDEDGVCHLDLSEGILIGRNSTDMLLSTRALVATLCTLESISAVEITVDGSDNALKVCAMEMPAVANPDWTFE